MLLIFGFRSRASKVSDGTFFCPHCGADRPYVLQQFRRWFTLFFLPIFPIGKAEGQQVKCGTCATAFRPEVLNTPTSAALSETIVSAMRVAAVAMLAAGDPGDLMARRAAVTNIRATGAEGFDDQALSNDIGQIDGAQLPAYLAPLAQGLNDHGKELFVSKLVQIGAAGGPLTESEQGILDIVAAGLGLSRNHLLGIITSVVSATRQPSTGDAD